MTNQIIIENLKQGVSSEVWDAPISDQIEGFSSDFSVNHGSTVEFKINVNADPGVDVPYRIEIYRLGYYGGAGATLVTTIDTSGQAQPDPITDARGVVDAGNWSVSASWATPAEAVSGVYLAKLIRADNGATNQIPFIVRQDGPRTDDSKSDIVLQTSDTTWQAYNGWGGRNGEVGKNLYDPNRAYGVSYNRPFIVRDGGGNASGAHDYLFGADYAAIYWLEKNGYDISYISGIDSDRLGVDALLGHKAFISVGHDEYWSGEQRANVTAARDAGVNLLFWSGNEVYWKTRWETSIVDGVAYRTLVTYKETRFNSDINAQPSDYLDWDPSTDWTGTWRDLRFVGNPGATGQEPENSLTGQLFGPDGTGEFGGALDVPAPFAGLRFWRDTSVAETGQLDIAPGILGYEWNTSPEDAYRPAGLIKLSDTTIPWSGILIDQGNRVAPGTATHNLSLYRDPESGALVFGAGTVFWSWGLSDQHDSSPYGANIENTALQQFTVNMFADMGIQPGVADAFLASQGLVRASGITDTVAATTTINDITSEVPAFSTVMITGTAADANGTSIITSDDGKVAVVEISLDGGSTWKVAKTFDNWGTWSYAWRPIFQGSYTIKARAIDDSLNVRNITLSSDTVTVTAPIASPSFSLFDPGIVTVSADSYNDGQPIELGMKFSASHAGQITQIKYFRAATDANDTDVRDGHLWRASDGALLATVTFNSAPGQSGWQVATLSVPVAIVTGVQYVVSYKSNDNYVSSTSNFFAPSSERTFDGLDNDAFSDPLGVLNAPQNDAFNRNGLYQYGTARVMPNNSFKGNNYWVDVTFVRSADTTSITLDVAPAAVLEDGTANLVYTFRRTGDTSSALAVNYTVSGTASIGSDYIGIDPAGTIKTVILAAGSATAVVSVDPTADATTEGDETVVLTLEEGNGYSIGTPGAVIGTITNDEEYEGINLFGAGVAVNGTLNNEGTPVQLGMTFSVSQAGQITELRYFRSAADANDTDIRTGYLWRVTDGALLATTTFTSASGQSGWQAAALSSPVSLEVGRQYVVSYRTENNYLATSNYFMPANEVVFDGVDNDAFSEPSGVLNAPQSDLTSRNGVYRYGTALEIPNSTFRGSNYWVDVSFVRTADTPSISLALAPATVLEDGTANLVYTFRRTGDPSAALTVNYTVSGTATNGTDYTGIDPAGPTKTVIFAAGSATATVIVDPTADTTGEGDETVALTLAAGSGYSIGTIAAVTGTFTNDDEPASFNLFGAGVSVNGTLSNDGTPVELGMTFSVSQAGQITELRYFRSAADANDTDIRAGHLWRVADGALLATTTFNSASGQSGWQAAALSTPVSLEVGTQYVVSYRTTNNYVATSNYFLPANEVAFDGIDNDGFSDPYGLLSAPQSDVTSRNGVYRYGTDTAIPNSTFGGSNYWVDVTFVRSADTPSITLAVAPAAVLEDGTANLLYTFTRTGDTSSALTVNYTVSGTASIGSDYIGIDPAGTIKTVIFAAGSATAVVSVDPTADATIEGDETVALTLAAGSGYSIGTTTPVTGTITNDDAIMGSTGNDVLTFTQNRDIITGAGGNDTFEILNLTDSLLGSTSAPTYDRITDLGIGNPINDIIDSPNPRTTPINPNVLGAVTAMAATEIGTLLSRTNFTATGAATFTFSSSSFLALNNDTAGYSATEDAIIEITGYAGNLSALQIL